MVCSVCLDVVFCFVDVTTVSLLAYTGLPSNCSGLTTTTCMVAPLIVPESLRRADVNALL